MTTVTAASLSEFDFIVMLDASASMMTDDMKGRTRWDYMKESLTAFVRDIQKLDSDGIGLVVFSGTSIDSYDGVTVDKLTEVLNSRRPMGSTPLAEALDAAFKLAGKSDKKDFILCVTDGTPDSREAAEKRIIAAAGRQQNDEDLTILFVQVGKDPGATAYLQHLDDGLSSAKFDIVDVKTIDEAEKFAGTTDMILAAIDG